jgi:hypothetical protein
METTKEPDHLRPLERILAEQRTLSVQLRQLNVRLEQLGAQLAARERLWRGEEGVDG